MISPRFNEPAPRPPPSFRAAARNRPAKPLAREREEPEAPGEAYEPRDAVLATLDLFAGDSSVVNPHDVQQWVDGLLGARYRGRLGARWPVRILGDVGTGGSSFTWEAVGTLGFEFAPCCAVNGGYRYLHYDYERGDNSENLGMGGPVVGLTFRF